MPATSIPVLLQKTHQFIADNVLSVATWKELQVSLSYWVNRHQKSPKQTATDILPTLTCFLAGGSYEQATPLSAFWLLYVMAARIFDDIQDKEGQEHPWHERGMEQSLPTGLALLPAANICLAHLSVETTTWSQIMKSMGSVWLLAAKSQSFPLKKNDSLATYFEQIITNTAEVFAAAAWSGARLATTDADVLHRARAFGHHVGMMSAIVSDCHDLRPKPGKPSDLTRQLHKLPLLYAINLTEHQYHAALMDLLQQATMPASEAHKVVDIIENMGAIDWSLQLAKRHQQKALAAIDSFPNNHKEHLVNYVTT